MAATTSLGFDKADLSFLNCVPLQINWGAAAAVQLNNCLPVSLTHSHWGMDGIDHGSVECNSMHAGWQL